MADLALSCSCGTVQGMATAITPDSGTHAVCYCRSCQAFARHLQREGVILDPWGGTEVFQITPSQIKITAGADQIRCIRLGPKGIYRWYSGCCNTAIGNTLGASVPFIGLIHSFITPGEQRSQALGPVLFKVFGQYARQLPQSDSLHPGLPLKMLARNLPKMLMAKLRGRHKPSPFFSDTGAPVSEPQIIAKPGLGD